MRKKDIIAMLSLILVSGGFVVRDIHNYNTQSEAIKYECIKIDSPTDKIEKLSKECEGDKRQIYIEDQLNKLREEKRLEERKRQEEELRRQQEEQQRLQQEQANQVANRGGDVGNKIYCKFEVSFYTTSPDEGSGTGLGASGISVQTWHSIAMPKEIPFFSEVYIEGLGTFINHDTGSYISSYYDEQGNKVYRCDVLVNSKAEAYSLGRQYRSGYILLK